MKHIFVTQIEGIENPVELASSEIFDQLLQLPEHSYIKLPCKYNKVIGEIEKTPAYYTIRRYVLDLVLPALFIYVDENENNK